MRKIGTLMIATIIVAILVASFVAAANISTQVESAIYPNNEKIACNGKGADFNEDGKVNGNDVNAFIIAYDNKDLKRADMNCDGIINENDKEIFVKLYDNYSDGLIDIAVTKLVMDQENPILGEEINFKFIVKNLGNVENEVGWGYQVYVPEGAGFGSGGCCVELYPDEQYVPSFSFTPKVTGEYKIVAKAHPHNSHDDNPENNAKTLSFEVKEQDKITDLAIKSIKVLPENPKVGDKITVFVSSKNLGEHTTKAEFVDNVHFPSGIIGYENEDCCITIYSNSKPYTRAFTFKATEAGTYIIKTGIYPKDIDDKNPENNVMLTRFKVEEKEDKTEEELYLPIIGDFNEDQKVNSIDLTLLLKNWKTGNPLYDENGNGIVDIVDVKLMLSNWGKGKMLRADIVHAGESHCKITNAEVALVKSHIGFEMEDTLTRLADINNDGKVTEKDVEIMRDYRDISQLNDYAYKREDLNCDGRVNKKDVEVLKNLWGPMDYNFSWADINEDGNVNANDFFAILAALS